MAETRGKRRIALGGTPRVASLGARLDQLRRVPEGPERLRAGVEVLVEILAEAEELTALDYELKGLLGLRAKVGES